MIYFVINPRVKERGKVLGVIARKMHEAGEEFEFMMGESKEETQRIVSKLTSGEGETTVVAVGGDGTVNDVLSGMVAPERVIFGIVPVGTGNDFCAAAKIPEDPEKAMDIILGSRPKATDYIECANGMRSMNIAGVGIDVDILMRCYRMKRGGAKGKYFRGLLASLLKYRGQSVEVCADGKIYTMNALIVGLCNGTRFGGGIRFCPPAVIDDGKLDLMLVEIPKRRKIPFALLRLMRGKIMDLNIVKHILCERARIVQVEGKAVQLDGELAEMRVLDAHVVSGALRMYRG